VCAVRAFLVLADYYRRFIHDYGAIMAPLTNLLRKEAFRWSDNVEMAFRALQRALMAAPVLQLSDFDREFIVECDASSSGFGAVLHQGTGPVVFYNKQIAPRHTKLTAYERELIGLVLAVRHWRPYLWGYPFLICTDHFSLKFLLDQNLSTIPQHQWASKLLGFDFRVEYKPGSTNVVTDALSRRDTDEEAQLATLSTASFDLFDMLRAAYNTNTALQQLRTEVAAGNRGDKWRIVDGLVTMVGRIHIPAALPLVQVVVRSAHAVGHEGMEKTLHRLRSDFHIPGARAAVQEIIHACTTCQRNKTEQLHPAGLLQPLDVPTTVWADIAMDFVEGLSRVHGKSVILTVIDRFSKSAHFLPLGHPYIATTVARAFFDGIVRLHGIPSSIVSDRDLVFTSQFWRELNLSSAFKIRGGQEDHYHVLALSCR
jgi:hypothetical protein